MKARYVISHTGKKGGPWEATLGTPLGTTAHDAAGRLVTESRDFAEAVTVDLRAEGYSSAKVIRLVRKSKSRALRDAVVETAIAWEVEREELGVCSQPCCTKGAQRDHVEAVNALRARLAK